MTGLNSTARAPSTAKISFQLGYDQPESVSIGAFSAAC
jgi:hypothetical protein